MDRKRNYTIDVTGESVNHIVNMLTRHRLTLCYILLIIGTGGFIFWAIIEHFSVMIFYFLFIVFLFISWPLSAKKSVKRLKKTDSLYCVNEILNGYVHVDPTMKMAFTDTFLYNDKDKSIIRYDDVVWIYKKVTRHSVNFVPTHTTQEVIVRLIDRDYYTFNVIGTMFDRVLMAQLYARNPNVLLGYTPENQKEFEVRTAEAKNKKNM